MLVIHYHFIKMYNLYMYNLQKENKLHGWGIRNTSGSFRLKTNCFFMEENKAAYKRKTFRSVVTYLANGQSSM